MPKKEKVKLAADSLIRLSVCRREERSNTCNNAGEPLSQAPGSEGTFSETLPKALTDGSPRVLYYVVELLDRNARPTGLSNEVATLVGAPPSAIHGLTAALTDKGVLLPWPPFAAETEGTTVRIHRIEVLPPPTQAMRDGSVPYPVPTTQNFLIENGSTSAQALDGSLLKGKKYAYQAQRVFQVTVDGQTLELDGSLSDPVRIEIPE